VPITPSINPPWDVKHPIELPSDDFNPQAEVDKGDFKMFASAIAGWGWSSGCAVTPQGTPDKTVHLAAGAVLFGDDMCQIPACDLTVIGTTPPTDPQIALIGVDRIPIVSGSRTGGTGSLIMAVDPTTQGWAVGDRIVVVSNVDTGFNAASTTITGLSSTTLTYAATGTKTSVTDPGGFVAHIGVWKGAETPIPTKPPYPALPPMAPVWLASVFMRASEPTIDSTNLVDKRLAARFRRTMHLYSDQFGLGDGVTDDTVALTAFFTAISVGFRAAGSDRFSTGIIGEIGPGDFNFTPPAHGSVFTLLGPSPGSSGAVHVYGQGSGVTNMNVKAGQNLGQVSPTMTRAYRGANGNGTNRGENNGANQIFLEFASAHGFQPYQIICFKQKSRGMYRWAHYTILDNGTQTGTIINNPNMLMFMAGNAEAVLDDGNGGKVFGRTDSGGNLDGFIPDLTYFEATDPTTSLPNLVYALEYLLEPLQFKIPHILHIDRMTFQGTGKNFADGRPDPRRGMALRWSNRCHIGPDCFFDGWWLGPVSNCSAHGGQGPQNTDHNWCWSKSIGNCYGGMAFVDNSGGSWCGEGSGPGGAVSTTIASASGGAVSPTTITVASASAFKSNSIAVPIMVSGSQQIVQVGWSSISGGNVFHLDAQGQATLSGQTLAPTGAYIAETGYTNQYGGNGGGRDNHCPQANFGTSDGVASILLNDAGALQSFNWEGTNMKGVSYPVYAEGIDGVDPREPLAIDCLEGVIKIEAPGGFSFAYDESKRRTCWKSLNCALRMESGISINGADTGTPGGGGSVAFGQFPDYTDRAWNATDISLTTVSGMPTLSFVVNRLIFGRDGGMDIGTILAVGNVRRSGTDADTTAATKHLHSPTMVFTVDDVGLRIDQANLRGKDSKGNTTNGTDVVASIVFDIDATHGHTVVMAQAPVDGGGAAFTIHNDGTATQSQVCWASRVSAVDYSTPGGNFCTVSMPHPIANTTTVNYTGTGATSPMIPDLPGPYIGEVGEIGHMRWGEIGAWDVPTLFDTESLDRMTHAQQWFDLRLLTPGILRLIQDYQGPTTKQQLPSWRCSAFTTRNSTVNGLADGTCTGTQLWTSASARLTQFDVGRSISGTNIPANTTIAAVRDTQTAWLSNATTGSTTTGTWTIGPNKAQSPPRWLIERGSQRFVIFPHSSADTNNVLEGELVELSPTMPDTFTAVRRTDPGGSGVGSATDLRPQCGLMGASMGKSRAGGVPGVSTNCDTSLPTLQRKSIGSTSARVHFDSPLITVAVPGTDLTLADDRYQLRLADGVNVSAGKMLVDNGFGRVIPITVTTPPWPDAHQRIVGQCTRGAVAATPGNFVAAILLPERWT
jgi:hypothetical protein